MAAPSPAPIVTMDNASVRVGDRVLFRRTSWVFRPGEQWALIGPNGSGKTLFASALVGAVPVVGGELIAPEGEVVHVSFEAHKALAGEAPAAARWFSLDEEGAPRVRELLSQDSIEARNPFEVVTRAPAAARAFVRRRREIVALLGIAPLLRQPLPSLSNGETRKLLLARALLRQPRLLILDDPFAGLDADFRRHLKAVLARLLRQGSLHLLLIATHADELPRGITHVLRVDRFRVITQGRYAPRRKQQLFSAVAPGGRVRLPATGNQATGEDLVRLTNVTVRYGARVILRDVNWTIRRGESWALLGPNGSGKSALLSLIIGDNPQAYANDVRVFGHRRGDGESIWKLKRRIGSVSPELHLHFPQAETCLDTVVSGFADTAGCFRRPPARQRAAARRWLSRFGLRAYADQPFGSLSAGLQRMTLLARALVKSPELLVLDEPCQGLDAAHRAGIIGAIAAALRHTTAIVVTHRRDELPRGITHVFRLPRPRR